MGKTVSPTPADLGTAGRITAGYARYVFWVMFSISFLNYLDRNVLMGAANVVAKELACSLHTCSVMHGLQRL